MTFNQNIHTKADELAELIIRKQRDYGPKNILNAPIDPRLALVVRLNDKLARIASLISQGKAPDNEALVDTWMDIAGYGLIGLCVEDGSFELPLEAHAKAL